MLNIFTVCVLNMSVGYLCTVIIVRGHIPFLALVNDCLGHEARVIVHLSPAIGTELNPQVLVIVHVVIRHVQVVVEVVFVARQPDAGGEHDFGAGVLVVMRVLLTFTLAEFDVMHIVSGATVVPVPANAIDRSALNVKPKLPWSQLSGRLGQTIIKLQAGLYIPIKSLYIL